MAEGGLAMPLRDHFRPPLANVRSWEELHGGWPMMLVASLSRRLPPDYVAGPRVHLGTSLEIDVASYEYEVRVYDAKRHHRLVAAVEIVRPANKDRSENRRVFVAKCAALLQQHVSVAIVDVVTTRQFNLYADLLELIGQADPSLAAAPSPLYALACRWRREGDSPRLEIWAHAVAIGQALPTLPLWLTDNLAVPLELEASYEETCRILRIP
jgi:uncharacterized protein DUF4058